MEKYSPEQQKLHDKIKRLHDNGCLIVGLQSISTNIKYSHQTEKKWGETGDSVYSVLKRNREREERKKYLDTLVLI